MNHPKGERSRLDTLPQRLSGLGSAYVAGLHRPTVPDSKPCAQHRWLAALNRREEGMPRSQAEVDTRSRIWAAHESEVAWLVSTIRSYSTPS